jgi:carbonic anhydrase/acetyltransferase-like protein (isoleucine patch superfamily)
MLYSSPILTFSHKLFSFAILYFNSVWYGATVRGDVNNVTIGSRTSIGDRAVVHVAKIQGDFATSIGNSVTIGAGAVVHACSIEDLCIIGESAQVLDGATIGTNSIIAPGSAHDTLELAYLHSVENSKDYKQLIAEEEDRLDREIRGKGQGAWFDPNIPDPDDVLGQGSPGRIFNSTLTHPEEGLKMRAEREKNQ